MHWLWLLSGAAAIFSCKNLRSAENYYDLSNLDFTFRTSTLTSTPPSVTNDTVYVNPCGPVDKASGCPEDAQVCLVQRIETNGESIVARVMPYVSESLNSSRDLFAPGNMGIGMNFHGVMWGDSELQCTVVYSCSDHFETRIFQLYDTMLSLEFGTPEACAPSRKPEPPVKAPPEDSNQKKGWGLFHWLGFLIVMAFIVYGGLLIAVNYRSFGPRVEDWADVVRDLPYLVRDFIRKIVGTFGTRGGYSAI